MLFSQFLTSNHKFLWNLRARPKWVVVLFQGKEEVEKSRKAVEAAKVDAEKVAKLTPELQMAFAEVIVITICEVIYLFDLDSFLYQLECLLISTHLTDAGYSLRFAGCYHREPCRGKCCTLPE